MASPSRSANELLGRYAEYHRDRRNIATHLLGVPMIVFGLAVLLSRPALQAFGIGLTPSWVVFALLAAWYLTRGQFALGLAVSVGTGLLIALAHRVAADGIATWLGWGLGCSAIGWLIQLLGHYYEGRKRAFADDAAGLLVGPMFVALELLAGLGLFKALMADIERRAGPTRLRDLAQPATH